MNIDAAIPADAKLHNEEIERIEKHQHLKKEVGRIWGMKNIQIMTIVIGALGSVTKYLEQW